KEPAMSPNITDLLDRATDPDSTAVEAAACLSAAKRMGAAVDTPSGWVWRGDRLVPDASALPALRRHIRSRWDERAADEEEENEAATVVAPRPDAAAPVVAFRPRQGSRAARVIEMISH